MPSDLKFGIAEYLDPQSRFFARIALRHKIGWVPKEVMEYVREKRKNGERLKWNYLTLQDLAKQNHFTVVKWVGMFNEYVKKNICTWAARYDRLHMLKWARKQQPPLPDATVCFECFDNGNYDTLKWVVENGSLWDEDCKTGFNRYVSIVEAKDGWKNIVVNQVIFPQSWTTLMMASHFGHTNLVSHLLTLDGIDVNKKNRAERSSLVIACNHCNVKVVKLLLAHKDINVNIGSRRILPPLLKSCRDGKIEICTELLSHPNVDVNISDYKGQTAVDYAILNKENEISKLIKCHPKYSGEV
eukprot:g1977.t1